MFRVGTNVAIDLVWLYRYPCLPIEALDTKGKMSWYPPVLLHRIKWQLESKGVWQDTADVKGSVVILGMLDVFETSVLQNNIDLSVFLFDFA